jgi:hypothetical protein
MTVQSKRAAIIPKSIMPIYRTAQELQNFREQLHAQFEHRADSTMDLLDALCIGLWTFGDLGHLKVT